MNLIHQWKLTMNIKKLWTIIWKHRHFQLQKEWKIFGKKTLFDFVKQKWIFLIDLYTLREEILAGRNFGGFAHPPNPMQFGGINFGGWWKFLYLAGINFGGSGKFLYLAGINFGGFPKTKIFQIFLSSPKRNYKER